MAENLATALLLHDAQFAVRNCGKHVIIYHDFLPTPRRGSRDKSDKTHTQTSSCAKDRKEWRALVHM